MKQPSYITLLAGLFLLCTMEAQTDEDIHQILKTNDSLLFDRAFNKCETEYLELLIGEDFEFYHDISGVTNSKEAFIETMENGICNPNNTTKSRRELVGELETFPLKNNNIVYGALQNGTHRFFETAGGVETAGSIAKFSHLWVLENGQWYLKRVISFDHKSQNH